MDRYDFHADSARFVTAPHRARPDVPTTPRAGSVRSLYPSAGIRLPSKVLTEIHHHTIVQPVTRRYSKKRLAYRIVQKHKNYEFFGVRVREQIASVTTP